MPNFFNKPEKVFILDITKTLNQQGVLERIITLVAKNGGTKIFLNMFGKGNDIHIDTTTLNFPNLRKVGEKYGCKVLPYVDLSLDFTSDGSKLATFLSTTYPTSFKDKGNKIRLVNGTREPIITEMKGLMDRILTRWGEGIDEIHLGGRVPATPLRYVHFINNLVEQYFTPKGILVHVYDKIYTQTSSPFNKWNVAIHYLGTNQFLPWEEVKAKSPASFSCPEKNTKLEDPSFDDGSIINKIARFTGYNSQSHTYDTVDWRGDEGRFDIQEDIIELQQLNRNYLKKSKNFNIFNSNNTATSPVKMGVENGINYMSGKYVADKSNAFFISTYTMLFLSADNYTEVLHNKRIIVSCDVMANEDIEVGFFRTIGDDYNFYNHDRENPRVTKLQKGQWTRIHCEYIGDRMPALYSPMRYDLNNEDNHIKLYHKNWKVETGTSPTLWTPAPEDISLENKILKATGGSCAYVDDTISLNETRKVDLINTFTKSCFHLDDLPVLVASLYLPAINRDEFNLWVDDGAVIGFEEQAIQNIKINFIPNTPGRCKFSVIIGFTVTQGEWSTLNDDMITFAFRDADRPNRRYIEVKEVCNPARNYIRDKVVVMTYDYSGPMSETRVLRDLPDFKLINQVTGEGVPITIHNITHGRKLAYNNMVNEWGSVMAADANTWTFPERDMVAVEPNQVYTVESLGVTSTPSIYVTEYTKDRRFIRRYKFSVDTKGVGYRTFVTTQKTGHLRVSGVHAIRQNEEAGKRCVQILKHYDPVGAYVEGTKII